MSAVGSINPAQDEGLIFAGQDRVSCHWQLALMLVLSLLAHAAGFYVLQVAYTPTGSLLPPPAQVLLVPPGSTENTALEHWIDMADPSLMTQPRALSAKQVLGTLGFHYVPSYASVLQVFKPLPELAPAEPPPQTRKPGPVPAGLLPPLISLGTTQTFAAIPSPAASHTSVELTDSLRALLPPELPAVPPPGTLSPKPLDRTVFLVGVPAGGGTAWLFRQASSGDASDNGADADARDYLAQLRFKEPAVGGSTAPVWGWATFYWGRAAYP